MNKKFKKWVSLVLAAAMLVSTLLVPGNRAEAAEETLLNTYGSVFGYSGTCINLNQLRNANTLAHVKSQYNSITLENEMKPDAMLGYSATLISKDEARRLGYYVPSSMTETYVPRINFNTLDEVLKICHQNGLKMRAHTLVWHSQTPDWFFRTGYSTNYGYVSQAQMDLRMEYYVKSVIDHVYNSPYGDVVYAWDVVNEYQHATNCGWLSIYGNVNNYPSFVKKAFQYAHERLEYFGKGNSVSLFYNDFNTYMEVNDIITMVNFINSNGKICDGVGMQSHLNTNYPSVSYYTDAVKAFLNAGFEVQITELDVVNKGDTDQADYLYQIMSNLLALKKNGAKITGITIWGLSDDVTWIRGERPLLFSTLGQPKSAYYRMLEAYRNAGFTGGGNTSGGNNSGNNGNIGNTGNNGNTGSGGATGNATVVQCENMTKSGQYTGNVGNPFNGVALYANNDAVSFTQYFASGTHDFTLRGASNGSNTAKVDLVIGGQTKGTFSFTGTQATEVTIKNVSHGTGNQTVQLVVTTDDGSWDCYADYLSISAATGSNNNTGNNNNNNNNNWGNNNWGNNDWNNNNGNNGGNNNTGNAGAQTNQVQCESMTKSGQYTGNTNNPFNGVALYANNDKVSFSQYFAYDTHNFTLRGASNNSKTAKVDLVINGQTVGTFSFGNNNPTEYTIQNVKHTTGQVTIELLVTTDDGSWDAYIDYLKF